LDGCNVEALAFHPQKRLLAVGGIDWLATGGSDGAVSLWDVEQRCEVETFPGGVTGLVFHPNGRRLATATLDSCIDVWSVDSGTLELELMGHEGPARCVAWSPDGKLLASGGDDRIVRLWDADTGAVLGMRELDTQIKAVRFAPDGAHLFTANGNTTVY